MRRRRLTGRSTAYSVAGRHHAGGTNPPSRGQSRGGVMGNILHRVGINTNLDVVVGALPTSEGLKRRSVRSPRGVPLARGH